MGQSPVEQEPRPSGTCSCVDALFLVVRNVGMRHRDDDKALIAMSVLRIQEKSKACDV